MRLTESMVRHILDHHGKELHISTADEAISFVKDVMEHFDHIRLGDNGSLVFSIENGRNKTGRRAITILLNSDSGDFYGVKTSGYEVMRKLAKRPLLWERGVNMVSSSDAVTEPVTSLDDPQDGGQSGNASGQSSSLSEGKDSDSSATVQGNGEKVSENQSSDGVQAALAAAERPRLRLRLVRMGLTGLMGRLGFRPR